MLDIFAGSNTTGEVAEKLGRKWVASEIEQSYLVTSAFRFLDKIDEPKVRALHSELSRAHTSNVLLATTNDQAVLEVARTAP